MELDADKYFLCGPLGAVMYDLRALITREGSLDGARYAAYVKKAGR